MPPTIVDDPELERLLEYLKSSRAFDFTGYKRASLARRIGKRMQSVKVAGYGDYIDYLEVHPEEFATLFDVILINVTSFFRDDAAWTYLREEVLPELLQSKPPRSPIRVWSAGCASGEEAYTLAIVLAELLGADQYRDRVKIYATDVDESALSRARAGVYSEREVAGVSPDLLAKYFQRLDSHYTFRKEFRRQVIFGRHDLVQDAPISHVDLLVCRNALMYFNSETQARILSRFHFALNDGGILFLGRAETLLTHASTFTPVDLKRRISRKAPRSSLSLRDRLLVMQQGGDDGADADREGDESRLREVAFDASPVAQLVVDTTGRVVLVNDPARALFGMASGDIGRPLQDLTISYRPIELRSQIERVQAERRPVVIHDVGWHVQPNDARWLEVQVVPLFDAGNGPLGVSVSFIDVSTAKRLQQELERTNQELEAAYEELQSTNEELETTNEELQSTVEELETTNEELHSTNEELETMNEELQFTNKELTTMNEELRTRSDELADVNAFLQSVLTSMRGGVVVVNPELLILVWNHRAEDLWGLREEDVAGKHLLGLDIGLPIEQLRQPVRACLSGVSEFVELELDAINRRGKPIRCRVTCTRLQAPGGALRGAILVMEDLTANGDGSVQRATSAVAER
jgi:two-component system CheB/CheR fusion protein